VGLGSASGRSCVMAPMGANIKTGISPLCYQLMYWQLHGSGRAGNLPVSRLVGRDELLVTITVARGLAAEAYMQVHGEMPSPTTLGLDPEGRARMTWWVRRRTISGLEQQTMELGIRLRR